MRLEYTKDISGNAILQDETGQHQVMMEWEKPYMEACIDKLDISGSVLEIGFGLGYSAHRICSSPNITEYTVIECSPIVWEKVEEFKKEFPLLTINLIKGRWQDILQTAGKYDKCFFDDYIDDTYNSNRLAQFISVFLPNHAKLGCQVGSFSGTYSRYDNIPFIEMECERFMIDIPSYCNYAKGNKMYINLITKIREPSQEEMIKFKKSINDTGLIEVKGVVKTTSKTTFTAISGSSTQLNNTYKEIEDLYFAKTDMNKLDEICKEYLQENTANNRGQRMIKFYQAYANFYSNPQKSKEIFQNLLENQDLEDDIKGWTISNLSLIE